MSLLPLLLAMSCTDATSTPTPAPAAAKPQAPPPPLDPHNIVSIAAGSKEHRTLVAALQAADYVRSVANPGPLTVFAPTDAAFAKLPAGTVEGLLQPARIDDLRNVLKYHVAAAVYEAKDLVDGMQLGMANMQKVTVENRGGKVTINGANIVTSIRASNGIVHVLDGVLLPPQ
ncbi:MAG: fasciclin domain-containing protein [Planctomycetes bacterium]|nr:fasciclin domain-containing protein [Planctomycetota bacterium]